MVAKQRRADEAKRDLTHAWLGAMYARQKTLPKLERELVKIDGPKRQTLAEQRMMLDILSAQYKIPLMHAHG